MTSQQIELDTSGNTVKITTVADDGATHECSGFVDRQARRADLCLSSMAGCAMGCVVCATTHSSIPFQRKLTGDEIGQQASDLVHALRADELACHLGFFGDGEALANWPAVAPAIHHVLTRGWHVVDVTISTTGMPAGRLTDLTEFALCLDVPLRLQVSLYSMDPRVRRSLLPKARPLEQVQDELDDFAARTGAPVRYNYPVVPGLNDNRKAIDDLVGFVRGAPSLRRLKLSRVFAVTGSPIASTCAADVEDFAGRLAARGLDTSVFLGDDDPDPRVEDAVRASCGQLRTL